MSSLAAQKARKPTPVAGGARYGRPATEDVVRNPNAPNEPDNLNRRLAGNLGVGGSRPTPNPLDVAPQEATANALPYQQTPSNVTLIASSDPVAKTKPWIHGARVGTQYLSPGDVLTVDPTATANIVP